MKICFDVEEFKEWLEIIDMCDENGAYHIVEGSNVLDIWESNIYGVVTKHRDLQLKGEIQGEIKNLNLQKKWNEIIGKDKESGING